MVHVTWGLIIASGKGEQITPEANTPFLDLIGKPVLTYALTAYERCPDIDGVVLVVPKDRMEGVLGMCQMFGFSKVRKIVPGTTQRQGSVQCGLKQLDEEVSIVSIHDASRPCVTSALVSETVKAAKRYGSGVAAHALTEAVKEVAKGLTVKQTVGENTLWLAQTPQTFKVDVLLKGYKQASRRKKSIQDDDSFALELLGEEVHLVESTPSNLRIRSADDLKVAASLLRV
jgi:2-C-methyl-D-erythritol 4-phosphate cytidylyltransferase